MEDINLHFTGDFHAITSAHNLPVGAESTTTSTGATRSASTRAVWLAPRHGHERPRAPRDRLLARRRRQRLPARSRLSTSPVGRRSHGDLLLATDLEDLKRRLGDIIVAYTRDRKPVRAKELNANGAMTALLKDAIAPNLVQTLERARPPSSTAVRSPISRTAAIRCRRPPRR
jgi:formate--tetrahydrofolate ligase